MDTDALMNELSELRKEIDAIDGQIIELLSGRFKRTRRIGEIKRDAHLNPVDSSREGEMYERIRKRAEESGVDPDVAEQLWRSLIARVVTEHRAISEHRS